MPERMALAIAHAGGRVLYCENPVSRLRGDGRQFAELAERVYGFGPVQIGGRLNRLPLLPQLQARIVVEQILRHAAKLGLRDPIFIYAHGEGTLPVCLQMKREGFLLAHVCMDYPEPGQEEHVEISDITLVIPRTVYHKLRARFGTKVFLTPQSVCLFASVPENADPPDAPDCAEISRPRLGYLGAPQDRLNTRVVRELLANRPDWQFVSFGVTPGVQLPNLHVLKWRKPDKLPLIIAGLDVGFMPYDCFTDKNFHSVPLKVFDYFWAGIPVVATPMVNLWQYEHLIYFGDTAEEIGRAVARALDEPRDSPKRKQRMEIAAAHSIENLSAVLEKILGASAVAQPDSEPGGKYARPAPYSAQT